MNYAQEAASDALCVLGPVEGAVERLRANMSEAEALRLERFVCVVRSRLGLSTSTDAFTLVCAAYLKSVKSDIKDFSPLQSNNTEP
jgi:hypothetical protein